MSDLTVIVETSESEDHLTDHVLLDPSDPFSVINLMPVVMRSALEYLDKSLLSVPEKELSEMAKPDLLLRRFRASFWEEYVVAKKYRRKMVLKKILNGLCTREYFLDNFVADHKKLAFLLKPPIHEADRIKDIMEVSLSRVQEFLHLSPIRKTVKKKYDKDGNLVSEDTDERIDVSYINAVQRISESSVSRIHGSVVQRVSIQKEESPDDKRPAPVDELKYIEAELAGDEG